MTPFWPHTRPVKYRAVIASGEGVPDCLFCDAANLTLTIKMLRRLPRYRSRRVPLPFSHAPARAHLLSVCIIHTSYRSLAFPARVRAGRCSHWPCVTPAQNWHYRLFSIVSKSQENRSESPGSIDDEVLLCRVEHSMVLSFSIGARLCVMLRCLTY